MKGRNTNIPRFLVITDHLAPYNVHTFDRVHQRGNIKIEVAVLFEKIAKHDYWPKLNLSFPCLNLSVSGRGEHKRRSINWSVLHAIRAGRYDVIGVSGYSEPTQGLALVYCILSGRRFIWIIDSILQTPRNAVRKALKRIPIRLIGKILKAAWVPGVASAEYLGYYGVPHTKVFQGCYCLDTRTLQDQASSLEPDKTRLRREFRIPENAFVFLFIGRMILERGLPFLLKAFKDLQEIHQEAFLVLIGTGPVLPQINEFISESNLRNVKIFPPTAIDHLAAYYVASDCYVHPSISETYSLTTAHAAIVGKPMIVSDQVGAAHDYLREGLTGYKVEAGDPKSLKHAMEKMIRSSQQARQQMGSQAKQVATLRDIDWAASQLEAAVKLSFRK